MASIAMTHHSDTGASWMPAPSHSVTPVGMWPTSVSMPALSDCTTRNPSNCGMTSIARVGSKATTMMSAGWGASAMSPNAGYSRTSMPAGRNARSGAGVVAGIQRITTPLR
ncbi:MAG: hypothetical protein JOZ75_02675 [Candidatus Dormibacteraeota bacterium]|nr:hypothetical protein [Candidatus Dormibacteraeota bacterium]